MPKTIFCLMGPTASGKTALASKLVMEFPLEIISVDSAMVYKEMDIGTAKPSAEILVTAPHHLIDVIEPSTSYSAAQFCKDAQRLIEEIYGRRKIPLLVGGTMLYFHALQQGLSHLPQADNALRSNLLAEANTKGWTFMHEQLMLIDPQSAARIHQNDTQRIQRALEVYYLTGKPLSFFLATEKTTPGYHFVNLILMPAQRTWLHAQIATRFEQMLEQGLINEVRQLLDKWNLALDCPAMRSVGYRQVTQFLNGQWDYEMLRQKGIAATRQLAKRQLTWLRNWPQASFFACENQRSAREIMAMIKEILDNTSHFDSA